MKKFIVFTIVVTMFGIFNGCQKDDFLEVNHEKVEIESPSDYKEGQMVIGEKLTNPYSVENMTKAYNNLVEANALKSGVEIEATHYYVRFRPKDFRELDMITRDTTLDIYDYPLDVEIKRGGTHYHDPSIPTNEITWQYTVVPVDYDFPKVQYQKLANLYLIDETNEYVETKSGSIDYLDYKSIEYESLKITGNLKEQSKGARTKGSSWRPSGTIRVFDDIIDSYSTRIKVFDHYDYYDCETGEPVYFPGDDIPDDPDGPLPKSTSIADDPADPVEDLCKIAVYRYETNTTNSHFIPLEGVEVRARSWFTTHKGYVDANGNFTCDGTFTSDANYSIKWERYNYSIREEDWGQAYFNGPKMTGDWNLNINSGKSLRYATIHRAAYLYYYKNIDGLKKPPLNDWYKRQLKIGYYHRTAADEINGDANPYWPQWYTWPDLRIFGENINGWRNTRDIFATTIHELAHASHWDLSGKTTFIGTENKVAESWARGVQWYLTRKIYLVYTPDYFGDYTGIVEDMVDDVNGYYDQVSNYTMPEIEGALKDKKTWNSWRDNIINKYDNETEGNLQTLFNHW